MTLYVMLPKGAISAKDASFLSVSMTFPSDTPESTIKQRMSSFEKKMADLKGYDFIISQYGTSEGAAKYGQVSDPDTATFAVIMKKDADADAFLKKVNQLKKSEQNVTITASPSSMFGGSSNSAITYDVVGNNSDELISTSNKLMDKIKTVDGVKKVSSNQDKTAPVYKVKVDTSKVNTQQAAMQLRGLINPQPIGVMTLDGKATPVILDAGVDPSSPSELSSLTIATNKGIVPLSDVATITENDMPSTVLHKDGKLYVRVTAEVDPAKLSVVAKDIDQKVKKVDLPKGVDLVNGGAGAQQSSDFADLGLTMLASILIVDLILVLTFKTLRAPLAILMTVPLASIGAVLGLLIAGVPADPTALIGGLMLIGIVITNAIVLIDRVKQNEETMIIRDAIIEACGTRLRPVIMTAIATVCAMLPLLFAHAEDGSLVSKSLAVVVIGGLTGATVLTLIIVPVFYELLHFKKAKKQRRLAAAQQKIAN
jgi:HAE1 family hydrophobic/amphiphilic exporter-1